MNVIFAGTPEFAACALRAIIDAGHHVSLILTQPDRPAGRGMQLQPSAVKQVALDHAEQTGNSIPVCQPRSLKLDGKFPDEAQGAHTLLRAANADVMVVAAYGLILPLSVLTMPHCGCLNIHASLLPRWRGAAPIHRAIESGDTETGITIMQMDEGLDTGAMVQISRVGIADNDTTGSLHDKLALAGADAIVQALSHLRQQTDGEVHGKLAATPQPDDGITYAEKIRKEEAALDFSLPVATLLRQIRAFNPAPGAAMQVNNELVKIWQASAGSEEDMAHSKNVVPGTIVGLNQHGLLIRCGDAVICITELQKAGGKRMPAHQFQQAKSWSGAQVKR